MIIPVYWSAEYTSKTEKENVFREVKCERCEAQYVYKIVVQGFGSAKAPYLLNTEGAKRRAAEDAAKFHRDQREQAFDIVPCPGCGWYQENMVRTARSWYLSWPATFGWIFIVLAIVLGLGLTVGNFFAGGFVSWLKLFLWISAVTVFGLAIVKFCAAKRKHYTPNSDSPAKRIERGQARAMLRKDFDLWVSKSSSAVAPRAFDHDTLTHLTPKTR